MTGGLRSPRSLTICPVALRSSHIFFPLWIKHATDSHGQHITFGQQPFQGFVSLWGKRDRTLYFEKAHMSAPPLYMYRMLPKWYGCVCMCVSESMVNFRWLWSNLNLKSGVRSQKLISIHNCFHSNGICVMDDIGWHSLLYDRIHYWPHFLWYSTMTTTRLLFAFMNH